MNRFSTDDLSPELRRVIRKAVQVAHRKGVAAGERRIREVLGMAAEFNGSLPTILKRFDESKHPRDGGKFAATAGSGGDTTTHASAAAEPDSPVPPTIRQRITTFAQGRYTKLVDRYGPTGAKAIIVATVALLPIPLPGTNFIPLAVAEAVKALRNVVATGSLGLKAVPAELDDETVQREAAALLAEIQAEVEAAAGEQEDEKSGLTTDKVRANDGLTTDKADSAPDAPALIAEAMLEYATQAAETGEDAAPGLQRLQELADDPQALAELLGSAGVEPDAVGKSIGAWIVRKAFDESSHPRDDHGRFVAKHLIHDARTNPKVAADLRKKVTNPEERKKLDAAIGKGDVVRTAVGKFAAGTPEAHVEQSKREETRRQFDGVMRKFEAASDLRGQITHQDLTALAEHLPNARIVDLRRARDAMKGNALHAGFGGAKRKAEMIDALVEHARGHAGAMRVAEFDQHVQDYASGAKTIPAPAMPRSAAEGIAQRVTEGPQLPPGGIDPDEHRRGLAEVRGEHRAEQQASRVAAVEASGKGGILTPPKEEVPAEPKPQEEPAPDPMVMPSAARVTEEPTPQPPAFTTPIPPRHIMLHEQREKQATAHRAAVEAALAAGKPVAPEDLAKHPDLAAKVAAKPTAATPAPKPPADPDKPKVEYVRAKAGGQVSDVDGKHYAGGQLMPIHGKYSGQEKKPAGAVLGGPATPTDPNSEGGEGGGGGRRTPRGPLTSEQLAEEQEKVKRQSQWNEMNAGPLGKMMWLGNTPNHKATSGSSPRLKEWREFAEQVGPKGIQHIVSKLEPEFHQSIDAQGKQIRDEYAQKQADGKPSSHFDKPPDADFEEWYKNDAKNRAQNAIGYMPGGKGHEKRAPNSHYARELLTEMMDKQNHDLHPIDNLHRLNSLLKEASSPPTPTTATPATPAPAGHAAIQSRIAELIDADRKSPNRADGPKAVAELASSAMKQLPKDEFYALAHATAEQTMGKGQRKPKTLDEAYKLMLAALTPVRRLVESQHV